MCRLKQTGLGGGCAHLFVDYDHHSSMISI
jgi:hypothetical protein